MRRKGAASMPLINEIPGIKILQQRLHALVPLGDKKAFVKYAVTDQRHRRVAMGIAHAIEKRALKALKGLAVPVLLDPPPPELRRLIARPASSFTALERAPGRELHVLRLPLQTVIGYWCAVAEQLVAFRRTGILYSDVKTENVLASRRPLRITILDFDLVCPVAPNGLYPSQFIGYTLHCAPPELGARRILTEASVVYQLGMLWVQSANPSLDNARAADPARIGPLLKNIEKTAGARLVRLLQSCIAADPQARPQGYEDVLRGLREAGLPRKSLVTWSRLRAPYERALRALGLEDPLAESRPRPGRGRSSGRASRSSR